MITKDKNIYLIEYRIETLAKNKVVGHYGDYKRFSIANIEFSDWDQGDKAWIARGKVKESDFLRAINSFRRKLKRIVPCISLVSQCYIEYDLQPFFVQKQGSGMIFFRCVKDLSPTGLPFGKKEKQAVEELLKNKNIPDEFYCYWNDVVNTPGYPKLSLMFSALDTLTWVKGKRDYTLAKKILGKRLSKKIYGTKGKSRNAFRNRLVHGEYLSKKGDRRFNFVEAIHNKIVLYFNKEVLSKDLIREDVRNPHRSSYPIQKRVEWFHFVKKTDESNSFDLKDLLAESDDNVEGFRNDKKYQIVYSNDLENPADNY